MWPILLLWFALQASICVVQRLVGAYQIDLARPAADKMHTTKFQCRVVSERE